MKPNARFRAQCAALLFALPAAAQVDAGVPDSGRNSGDSSCPSPNGCGTSLPLERFEEGLAAFRERRWQEAEATFEALLEQWPDDGPSRLYMMRSRAFASDPPSDDWNGVTVMETK